MNCYECYHFLMCWEAYPGHQETLEHSAVALSPFILIVHQGTPVNKINANQHRWNELRNNKLFCFMIEIMSKII